MCVSVWTLLKLDTIMCVWETRERMKKTGCTILFWCIQLQQGVCLSIVCVCVRWARNKVYSKAVLPSAVYACVDWDVFCFWSTYFGWVKAEINKLKTLITLQCMHQRRDSATSSFLSHWCSIPVLQFKKLVYLSLTLLYFYHFFLNS